MPLFRTTMDVRLPAGLAPMLHFEEPLTGTVVSPATDPFRLALFYAPSDDVDSGAGFVEILVGVDNVGGANAKGGRNVVAGYCQLVAPTNAANPNRNYTGTIGEGIAFSGDGGTNTGAGALGAIFGGGFVGRALNGATNLFNVTGGEGNVALEAGSSAAHKTGWQVVALSSDAVSGAITDAGYSLSAESGAIGFNYGFILSNQSGQMPLKATGIVFYSLAATYADVFNLTLATITGNLLAGPGVSITGAGGFINTSFIWSASPTAGVGYFSGAGGAVTQLVSRVTAVTLNKVAGDITLFNAAGSAAATTFTVNNSTVTQKDNIILNVQSATDKIRAYVTRIFAGGFDITFETTGGVTVEQPVFHFSVLRSVNA